MKKKVFVAMMVFVVLFCSVTAVFAHSSIKLFINGEELKSDVSPKVAEGRVLVPIRVITERLGALINWNEKQNSIDIDFKEMQAQKTRISLLERALAPKDSYTAAKTWAEGVKTRNGALQYAVMSAELREAVYSDFVKLNWATGTSSPWIQDYEVIDRGKADDDTFWYAVEFTHTDSTQSTFTTREYVTIKNYEGNWLIASLEKVDIKGEITKVTYSNEKNRKVKSIFVEDDASEKVGYDKANVIIGNKTKIYDGYTDKKLSSRDLQEGVQVKVTFTDDPIAMVYPVTAEAETIRVMDEPQASPIVYENTRYGFTFSLPESWKGYTIVTGRWEGLSLERASRDKVVERGPLISIRHPEWTAQNPRQDIPIMILTHAQWNSLRQGKFSVGAAPVGPTEIDRNSSYVFALPVRYNYAFPTGYEEVEKILEANPLIPFDSKVDKPSGL